MKILGISGTPGKKGNSLLLLQHALGFLERNNCTSRLIKLSEQNIMHCTGFESCQVTGNCVQKMIWRKF